MRARLTLAIGIAAALGAGAAGCGGDDEAESGAASITPENAPVYVDLTVRPEGEAASDAEAALGKFIGGADPGQQLVTLIEKEAAKQGEQFDYETEIAPWLGQNFAIFLHKIGGDTTDSEGAFIFETTDVDEAKEFFDEAEDATGRTAEYEGVEYEFDTDGDVIGVIDEFIVGGDESGFKAAVDASKGDSLAESDEFGDAIDELPEDRLASLYVPPEAFIEALPPEELDEQSRALFEKVAGDALDEPILGDLTASADALSVELSAAGTEVETDETPLIESLPANAWLAFGLADLGAAVKGGIDGLDDADIQGVSAETAREELKAQTGIDLDTEVIEPLGDAAFFLQGASEADLTGAVVIETADPAATTALLGKLQELIRKQGRSSGVRVQPLASATGDQGFQLIGPKGELPQPVQVVQRGDRIVVGYGAAATEQALAGGSGAPTLAGSPAFTAAKGVIGDLGIDAFLSLPTVFQLAEASGAAADPEYQRAKPYLDKLGSVAIGSGVEDERLIARFVVSLTQ